MLVNLGINKLELTNFFATLYDEQKTLSEVNGIVLYALRELSYKIDEYNKSHIIYNTNDSPLVEFAEYVVHSLYEIVRDTNDYVPFAFDLEIYYNALEQVFQYTINDQFSMNVGVSFYYHGKQVIFVNINYD